MKSDKLSIFISHPSEILTNCQPHGDGLVAFSFIYHLAQKGHTLHVAVPSIDISGKLPENIKLYPVNVRALSEPLKSIEYMLKVRQLFNIVRREFKIDAIHQLNPVKTGLSLSLFGTGLPIVLGPFVAYWYGTAEFPKIDFSTPKSIPQFFKRLLNDRLSYIQQQQASALLASTPTAVQSKLHNLESNKDKIHHIPPGIDSILFSPGPNGIIGEKEVPTILFLASLEDRKGIFTLLDAFETVVDTLPSCQLVIAGSGTKLEEVQRRISTMSCQSQISLVGKVGRNDVTHYMRQCTVYCLPSYGEPFGMSALEAMACGKPVVATNLGGLADLVPDRGGRKVPLRDAQALADALLEILKSPELQVEMGQYNRSLVEEIYSWERVVERLESLYYKLITCDR